jgi:hypothetical protein
MSLNVHHHSAPDMMVPLTKYFCYAWKAGLKTASYYTRTFQRPDALVVRDKPMVVCTEDVCTACQ